MSILTSQKLKPIIFLLFGGGIPIPVPFGIPGAGIVRPERIDIGRQARGTVVNTAGGAFLDDFGEGIPQLVIDGHTGWNATILSGLKGLKLLETVFVEYLARRGRVAASGNDPNVVKLWYLDTLNFEAFSVYPHEFRVDKTKGRPLLYFYHMKFSVLQDLLQDAAFSLIGAAGPLVGGLISGFTGGDAPAAFDGLGDDIAGVKS